MGSRAAREIADLGNLPDNWDSYGAPPITRDARIAAESLIGEIQNRLGPHFVEPVVGPDVGGGVELMWEAPETEIHVYVPPGAQPKVVVLYMSRIAYSLASASSADVINALEKFNALR